MVNTMIVSGDAQTVRMIRDTLHRLGGFRVTGVYSGSAEALEALRSRPAELAFLEVSLPDRGGMELLRQLRSERSRIAAVMTADRAEMETVEDALDLGALDFLLRPFSPERLEQAARKYLERAALLQKAGPADQETADRLFGRSVQKEEELQKGLSPQTLDRVRGYLRGHPAEQHTCESLSAALGLSRVTARLYLNYLVGTGQAVSTADYRTGGRPRVLYRLK